MSGIILEMRECIRMFTPKDSNKDRQRNLSAVTFRLGSGYRGDLIFGWLLMVDTPHLPPPHTTIHTPTYQLRRYTSTHRQHGFHTDTHATCRHPCSLTIGHPSPIRLRWSERDRPRGGRSDRRPPAAPRGCFAGTWNHGQAAWRTGWGILAQGLREGETGDRTSPPPK